MLCAKEFVNDAVACDTVLAGALANPDLPARRLTLVIRAGKD